MPDSTFDATTVRLGAPPVLEVVRQRVLDLLLTGAPLQGPLSQIVDADAVLTGLLLRLVRCPLYDGAELRGLRTSDALERVGRPTLVHALTYLPGLPDRSMRDAVEPACSDWVHGLAVAAAARWLASTGEYEDLREAYGAGLLHDVGGRCGGGAREREAAVRRIGERWHLGSRTALVARLHEVVQHGLPPEKIGLDGRRLDGREQRLLSVVDRACRIAVALGFTRSPSRSHDDVDGLATASAEAVRLEIAHAAALLGFETDSPEDLVRVLTNEEVRLGEQDHVRPELGRDIDLVAEAHRRIVASRRLSSVGDIVARGLLAIREGLEMDRVLLLEPHPAEPFRLRGRAVSDPSELNYAGGVHGVAVELDGGGALQQVLERGRALLGGCDERDARLKRQFGVDSFAGAAPRTIQAADSISSPSRRSATSCCRPSPSCSPRAAARSTTTDATAARSS